MKYIVLGSSGFIGREIGNELDKENNECLCLTKIDFDITNNASYMRHDFTGATIIDCIAKIDNKEEDIFNTNVDGLIRFITYLNERISYYRYVYISSAATQDNKLVETSPYVRSKFDAERYIVNNVTDYKIIRLVFPFGKGENKKRLISRLIRKIKDDEEIVVQNTKLNLTPVGFLKDNIMLLMDSKERIINFSDGITHELRDIVDFICKEVGGRNDYYFDKNVTNDFTINPTIKCLNRHNVYEAIRGMIA